MAETTDERGGGLGPDDAQHLSERLADAAQVGLPMAPGLRALAQETRPGRLKEALKTLADALDRGESLDQALAARPGLLPEHLRGLVSGGLRTGKLGDVLGRFALVAQAGEEAKRNFLLGAAYPLLAAGLALIVFILIDVLIVTRFEAIFRDFGVQLPTMTAALIGSSRLFREGWPVFLAALGLALAGLLAFRYRVAAPRRAALLSRVPVLGGLWRYTSWAEFCHLMAIFLESGVPLPEALRLTGRGVKNADVDVACHEMARRVERGESLSEAMSNGALPQDANAEAVLRGTPKGIVRLLRWSESKAALAEMLRLSGEMFQARLLAQARFAGSITTVVAMSAVFLGLGFVVVGLFLPLITLVSKLSG